MILRGGYRPLERCRMGNGEYAFAASGNIYPCERLIGDGEGKNHRIGKMFIKSLDDMVEKVGSALRSIQRSPALIRSFFQHRECRYAAE